MESDEDMLDALAALVAQRASSETVGQSHTDLIVVLYVHLCCRSQTLGRAARDIIVPGLDWVLANARCVAELLHSDPAFPNLDITHAHLYNELATLATVFADHSEHACDEYRRICHSIEALQKDVTNARLVWQIIRRGRTTARRAPPKRAPASEPQADDAEYYAGVLPTASLP